MSEIARDFVFREEVDEECIAENADVQPRPPHGQVDSRWGHDGNLAGEAARWGAGPRDARSWS